MHVLMCHERFIFRFGVDRVLIALGKGLKDLGYEISVMGNLFDARVVERFASQIIQAPSAKVYLDQDEFTLQWLQQSWDRCFKGRCKPDLVLVAGWPFFSAIPFFRRMGCPVVFSDHGVVPLEGYSGDQLVVLKKLKTLRQQYLSQANAIVAVSNFILNSQSLPDSFRKVKGYTILNGADHMESPMWSADNLSHQSTHGNGLNFLHSLKQGGRQTILSLGRWEPNSYKNSDAAFDIMSRIKEKLPGSALLILADPAHASIPSAFKNHLLPIGFADDSELTEIMKSVDLGLCFSLWEGFNLPLAEMQWLNRPALAFDVGAHPEVILHPWYLCRDNSEMAEKACALLSGGGPDGSARLQALEAFQARFSWERAVTEYDSLFQNLIEETPLHLIIDVTNSVRDPANSGVIRVTRRLCRELQRYTDPIFVIWDSGSNRYVLPTEMEFHQLSQFNGPLLTDASWVSPNDHRVFLEDLLVRLDQRSRWLLFAEIVEESRARIARRFARDLGIRLAAIFYDAIAVLHPEFVNEEIVKNHSAYMLGLAQCDVVTPISEFSASCLNDFWRRHGSPKALNVPNLLPGEFGGFERVEKIAEAPSDEIRILCVSTLEPRKNHRTLINACLLTEKNHPGLNWSLTLVGNLYEGALKIGEFVKNCAAKNPRIKWLGIVDDATLEKLYQEATFTAYPSIIEGFGMPILESLWHSKPCICSNEGVMAELASEGGCLTTNVLNEDALSDSIYRLATDKELLLRLSREAVARKMKTWDDYVVEFVDILRKHMKSCPHAPAVAKDYAYSKWEEILYPGCLHDRWQMSDSERLALTAILLRHNPHCSIEVGTYLGGVLPLIAQHSDMVFSIDIDPSIPEKYKDFGNVSFLTGPSSVVFPLLLKGLEEASIPVDFVLIDGDHSAEAVSRDIASLLTYVPKSPLFIIIHDSFHPECRRGILEAGWEKSPYVHWVDVDFIPGRIIEHGGGGHGGMWGGLCLAYMHPEKNPHPLQAKTSAEMMFQKCRQGDGIPKRDRSILERDFVIAAYRGLLDRDPESETVIRHYIELFGPELMIKDIMASEEYRSRVEGTLRSGAKAMPRPRLNIELECPEDQFEKMTDHIQANWSKLGNEEPYWSVLTSEDFKKEKMGDEVGPFYATGQEDLDNLKLFCERNNIAWTRTWKCLEYGCGVGRVTKWLAETFAHVWAYDISGSHIRFARNYLDQQGMKNVTFRQITSLKDLERFEKADIIYTVLVLQHNPPPVITRILKSLLKALNPGGVALFQLLTYQRNYQFSAKSYLENMDHCQGAEMHVLPQSEVFRVVEETGCRLLEVAGYRWSVYGYDESHSFFVQKKVKGFLKKFRNL
jgi:glycosyltransferase involved in cell wall biosynthesis/2-polyprenyl-3-methyl-5-hydroxy-6-metoxy-1,4-benzoquinol methylase